MAKKEEPSLEELVRRMVRAEYMARIGGDPASMEEYWLGYEKAKSDLQERVTGERGYWKAAEALGLGKPQPKETGPRKGEQGGLF